MFDSNAMLELAHVKRDRYERNGGGGAHKVYASSRAAYEAKGWKELSPFEQACIEMLHRYRQICQISEAAYRSDCFRSREGFANGEIIPF